MEPSKLTDCSVITSNDLWGKVIFEKLYDDVVVPERATEGSAGFDLRAYLNGRTIKQYTRKNELVKIYADGFIEIEPWARALIPLGFKATVPEECEGEIRARSGNALKRGLMVINAPGTIDRDYAEEWGVLLWNASDVLCRINHKDRIAQVIIDVVKSPRWIEGKVERTTERSGGFGHTGLNSITL